MKDMELLFLACDRTLMENSNMKTYSVPVSVGELLDKISILEVKLRNINSNVKLKNVEKERDILLSFCDDNFLEQIEGFIKINQKIWDVLQKQRDKENAGELDEEFTRLSLEVYHLNDERFAKKSQVNDMYGSFIREEKQYH
tara:strand:+ start:12288 stop:12713 length:426 start_codon:yes stop_codon:yes gene_type:complete